MSFFVTSVGNGASGGNYGGLAGADNRCQTLAAAVGFGARTWRAYLGAQSPVQVHARDRIGTGPWYNYQGQMVAASVANLHSAGLLSQYMLTETGAAVPLTENGILTGANGDGTASTGPTADCFGWTSSSDLDYARVGYSNWSELGTSWNSWLETDCSQVGLASTNGSGRLYCFAID